MIKDFTITGRKVLIALFLFFGFVIFANIVFVTLAMRSFPGQTTEKSYLQGLNYNDILASRSVQAALGWQAEITGVTRDGEAVVIELRMIDAQNRPITNLIVNGEVRRPTHGRQDLTITFTDAGRGVYLARIDVLPPGAWDLLARAANDDGEQLDLHARILAP